MAKMSEHSMFKGSMTIKSPDTGSVDRHWDTVVGSVQQGKKMSVEQANAHHKGMIFGSEKANRTSDKMSVDKTPRPPIIKA